MVAGHQCAVVGLSCSVAPYGAPTSQPRRYSNAGTDRARVGWYLGNGGGLLLWLPPGAVIAAAAIYLLGVPLSLGLEARWPAAHGSAPVRRYVGLGAVVAVAVTVALVVSFPAPLVGSPLFALASLLLVSVPVGMIAGALAVGVACALPWRWAVAVAVAAPPACWPSPATRGGSRSSLRRYAAIAQA